MTYYPMGAIEFLQKRKYEVLLAGLIQHLFIGLFLLDEDFYTEEVWGINMVLVGIYVVGIFHGTRTWRYYLGIRIFWWIIEDISVPQRIYK